MKKSMILIGLLLVLLSVGSALAGADSRLGIYAIEDGTCAPAAKVNLNPQSHGGGWCTPDWECTDWSECGPDNKQLRSCEDTWQCGDLSDLPALYQECEYEGDAQELFVEPELFQNDGEGIIVPAPLTTEDSDNALTGAVVGGFATSKIFLVLLGLLILGLYGLFVAARVKIRAAA